MQAGGWVWPRRQYDMAEQAGQSTGVGKASGGTGGAPRIGQSGEGARSALEHLIQQERKREAQRAWDPGPPPRDPPAGR
jgi:hypothetical protein